MGLLCLTGCGGGSGGTEPEPSAPVDNASADSTTGGSDGNSNDSGADETVIDVDMSGRWVSSDNSKILAISSSGRVSRVVKTAQVVTEICFGGLTTLGQQFDGDLSCVEYLANPDPEVSAVPNYFGYRVSGNASEQGALEFTSFTGTGSKADESVLEPNYDFDISNAGSFFGEIIPGLYANELGNGNLNSQRLVSFIRIDSDGLISAVTPQQLRPNNTSEWLGVEAFCQVSGQIDGAIVGTSENRGAQPSFEVQLDIGDCSEAEVSTLRSLSNGARLKGDHNQSAAQAFGISGASSQYDDYFVDLYTPGNALTNGGNNAGWDRYYRVCDDAEVSRRTSYGITVEDQYTRSDTYPQGFANLCNDFDAR